MKRNMCPLTCLLLVFSPRPNFIDLSIPSGGGWAIKKLSPRPTSSQTVADRMTKKEPSFSAEHEATTGKGTIVIRRCFQYIHNTMKTKNILVLKI